MAENTKTKPRDNGSKPVANGYVSGAELLEILFSEASRPSLRWLRDRQRKKEIPFVRLGRLVMFHPELVKAHFEAKALGKVAR